MYDSVLDRYCELFTLGGLSYYLIRTGYVIGALITFVALVGSIMVSYVRARAEGLGLECKVGFMQRPERVVVTTIRRPRHRHNRPVCQPGRLRCRQHPHFLHGCDSRLRQHHRICPHKPLPPSPLQEVRACRTTSSKDFKGLHNSNHYHDRIFHFPRAAKRPSSFRWCCSDRGDKHLRRIPPRTSLHSRDADSAALHHGHFTPFRSGDVALRRLRHLI